MPEVGARRRLRARNCLERSGKHAVQRHSRWFRRSGFVTSCVPRQPRAVAPVSSAPYVALRCPSPLTSAVILFTCVRSRPLQYLVRRGVPEDDAARLLAYRDKALRAAASSAPAAPPRPPEPPALGVPVVATKAPPQAPAGASSSSAAATITLTRTVVTTKQEAEGVGGSAAPAVETRSTKDTLTVRAWAACGFCYLARAV